MKRKLIIICIILFCSFYNICFAYPNEKNGFRNTVISAIEKCANKSKNI